MSAVEPTALDSAATALGEGVQRDHPIGAFTTYRVGGRAALFLVVESAARLEQVATVVAGTGIPVLVIGKGSNLLVADAGFTGLAIMLGEEFATIDVSGTVVRAGGATALPVLARRTAAAGLTGLEWAVGVPGSVGGALRMNAGGHGSDIATSLRRWCRVDLGGGPSGELPPDALEAGYRSSSIRDNHVVVWAEFDLKTGDRADGEARISQIVRWRRDNQPGGQNCGSVFTNPPDDSAGRLIDAAGLRGHRLGTAQVSPKHANFIQADDGGSADDIVALIRAVQARVQETFGVRLHPEVRLVGFEPEPPVRS